MSNKIMNVLLIEDNKTERYCFEKYIKNRNDVKLVGSTDSDIEGLKLIKKFLPDAIILDIGLHNGSGNANTFPLIEELQKIKFSKKPKIVVNTVVCSNTIYDYLRSKGIDLIFYKKQQNYSVENIINTLVLLNGFSDDSSINENVCFEDNSENNEKISSLINYELDLIGISLHLNGRKYLHDAIFYLITSTDNDEIGVTQFLINKYKRSGSTISRNMQNAILHAWRVSSLEDLETYYTARINYETGVPTPTEFIYFYAEKIKKISK